MPDYKGLEAIEIHQQVCTSRTGDHFGYFTWAVVRRGWCPPPPDGRSLAPQGKQPPAWTRGDCPVQGRAGDYWKLVWKKALPHLGHRPLKLVRHVHDATF
jgi:hypothetical protein